RDAVVEVAGVGVRDVDASHVGERAGGAASGELRAQDRVRGRVVVNPLRTTEHRGPPFGVPAVLESDRRTVGRGQLLTGRTDRDARPRARRGGVDRVEQVAAGDAAIAREAVRTAEDAE